MNRYGSVVALPSVVVGTLAALVTACDGSDGLTYAVRVDSDIAAQATAYQARFFTGSDCADSDFIEGHLDVVLTSTPAIFETSATPDGFAPVDLSSFGGDLAVDLRALASDGTLLARRCTEVGNSTEEAIVGLARFADPGSRIVAVETVSLSAGEDQRPARVQVLDMAGMPAPFVFASLGPDKPLLRSNEAGFILIDTSSVTLAAGTTRTLRVHGVVGSETVIRAEGIAAVACPASTWSREIVPGLTGAQVTVAAADAGPRTLIAILRPETAASSLNTIEILAADEGATSLRSLATATTSASGPIAIAADRATGAAAILVVRGNIAEWRTFDGAASRLGPVRTASVGLVPGGAIDGLRGAWLTPAGAVFAAFGDVPSGAVSISSDLVVAPLLPGGDRAIVDLGFDADTALVTTAAGLERFVRVGGALQADGTLDPELRGNTVLLVGGEAQGVAVEGTTLRTFGPTGQIDTVDVGAGPVAQAAGDLNGDGVSDLMLLTATGARLVAVAESGRMVPSLSCAFEGGPRTVIALPLDRGGRKRWASVLDQTGRLALWVQP